MSINIRIIIDGDSDYHCIDPDQPFDDLVQKFLGDLPGKVYFNGEDVSERYSGLQIQDTEFYDNCEIEISRTNIYDLVIPEGMNLFVHVDDCRCKTCDCVDCFEQDYQRSEAYKSSTKSFQCETKCFRLISYERNVALLLQAMTLCREVCGTYLPPFSFLLIDKKFLRNLNLNVAGRIIDFLPL